MEIKGIKYYKAKLIGDYGLYQWEYFKVHHDIDRYFVLYPNNKWKMGGSWKRRTEELGDVNIDVIEADENELEYGKFAGGKVKTWLVKRFLAKLF